ncbi:hypothetical protein ABZX63_19305, partial [Streptomyces tendae]
VLFFIDNIFRFTQAGSEVSTPRDRTRRLALDLLPPVVTRAVRRYRAQRRAKAGRTPGTAQSRP